mgnify:CR=1 FL=1
MSVGTELDQLRFVGEITVGTTAIDLSPVAQPDEEFALVQLCDGPDTDSEIPGSDVDAVAALKTIYAEEVGHVAYGSKWFNFLCGRANDDPKETFHALVRRYFKPPLKPPFNDEKRAEADLPPDFYWPLVDETD